MSKAQGHEQWLICSPAGLVHQIVVAPPGSPVHAPAGCTAVRYAGEVPRYAKWANGGVISLCEPQPGERWSEERGGWEIPAPSLQEAWLAVRAKREALIAQTDWTQLHDVPQATQQLWQPYRQALRDVTQQRDPHNITWPVSPAERL